LSGSRGEVDFLYPFIERRNSASLAAMNFGWRCNEERYKRIITIPTVIWALPIPQPLSNKSLCPKNIISKIILLI
jgi:hypothetical protein